MLSRLLQIVLVLWIAICVVGTVRDQFQLTSIEIESERLAKLVGRLNVGDPTQIHVRNAELEPASRITWRYYLPAPRQSLPSSPRWRLDTRSVNGQGTRSLYTREPLDDLLRWQFIHKENGWEQQLLHNSGASSRAVDAKEIQFLQDHWDELDTVVAGTTTEATVATDKIMTLLSINVPESLHDKAVETFGRYKAKKLQSKPMYEIRIGSEKAFEAEKEAERQGAGQVAGTGATQ